MITEKIDVELSEPVLTCTECGHRIEGIPDTEEWLDEVESHVEDGHGVYKLSTTFTVGSYTHTESTIIRMTKDEDDVTELST